MFARRLIFSSRACVTSAVALAVAAGTINVNQQHVECAAGGGAIDLVLGAQWGDEGKGKLVDILSTEYDICLPG